MAAERPRRVDCPPFVVNDSGPVLDDVLRVVRIVRELFGEKRRHTDSRAHEHAKRRRVGSGSGGE